MFSSGLITFGVGWKSFQMFSGLFLKHAWFGIIPFFLRLLWIPIDKLCNYIFQFFISDLIRKYYDI